MTGAAIVACLATFATATAAVRAKGSGAEDARRSPSAPERRCASQRLELRRAVGERRIATWHWQDVLEVARTRSDFRERRARGCLYLGWLRALWAGRADVHWRLFASLRDPATAISFVFGPYAEGAVKVAWCESGLRTRARNGQYLGLFQMGSSERARYGHGPSALEQARAAHRYFVASGRDWSPWSCRWAAR